MDEITYRRHVAASRQAEKLYHELRELYGKDLTREKLFLQARKDKVITMEERRLLGSFYPY